MKTICAKTGRLLALAAALLILLPLVSLAETTSPQYTYDYWEEAVPTSPAYLANKVYFGVDFGIDALAKPMDLFVADDGRVFVLDSGNSRIVVLSADLQFERVIQPTAPDGEALKFQEAVGLYVAADGRMMVADKKGMAVYILDGEGRQTGKIESPSASVVPETFEFLPTKMLEDSAGVLYVLSSGCYNGALQFDSDGSFMGFYGAESVTLNAKTLMNYLWKQILTEEQAGNMARILPVEFISFCIDEKDFIYTIRQGNDVESGQVRKLNAKGTNVLPDEVFGDRIEDPMLNDIVVDDEGFISILDKSSGRVFQYDQESTLLYAFGGKGTQKGCFATAEAIESQGDRLLVLDSERGSITVFEPTAFARNIRKGSLLYSDGKYQEAMEPWKQVLASDYNYELANLGLGKAYEGLGDYRQAMTYFKLGNDRQLYADAFREYRSVLLRESFALFMLLLVALIVVPVVLISRKKKREVYAGGRPKSKYPFYCMFHPLNGYTDLKDEKSGSFWLANAVLLAFLIVSILIRQVTGFSFNENRTDQFNLLVTVFSTIGIFIVFVLCNWAITTIMDGKGRFLEIWTFCSYALVPYIIGMTVVVILSNILTGDESAFYEGAKWIVLIWTAFSMLIAIKEVHQYSLGKTLFTLFLTFCGMVVILIIAAIFYSVFNQLISFVATLATEISLR